MTSLLDLQWSFGAGLLGGDPEPVAGLIARDRLTPDQRFRVYANHVRITLTEALGATFPVVRRLVGAEFFAWAARRFQAQSPPRRACLFEYGDEFPGFLGAMPECRHLGYLEDVARFEWALNQAAHADDAPGLDRTALAAIASAALADLVFTLHPSCRLVTSPWPVTAIWRANQPGQPGEAIVEPGSGGGPVLIQRIGLDVVWRALDPGDSAFISALGTGRTLNQAWRQALATNPDFDLAAALGRLVAEGSLSRFTAAALN